MAKFVIRVDDVCPAMGWNRFDVFSETLRNLSIPCLIGVIPECCDPKLCCDPPKADFWDVIRGLKSAGWTIAQHCYTHVYDRLSRDLIGVVRKSEFGGHDFQTQVSRLESGAKILAVEGVATEVFMAPCHSFECNHL